MLRQEQSVTLGREPDTLQTRVREITPLLAEKLHHVVLGVLEDTRESITPRELADLMVGDAGLKLELLQECCDLGEKVHELGAMAFLQLWQAFEEINGPFLERLAGMLRQSARNLPGQADPPLAQE